MSKYFKEEIQLSVEFVNHHTVFMAPEIYGWSLRRDNSQQLSEVLLGL